ncbi:MAG: hypothetical protein PHN71_03525 [Candidatus Cloacimonetes bacterium]|jgi:ABC-type transporter Mla maintaining outer membrane lipid asymmetry ATPase subunit MlaF|nr:hypothetical protein [Candidatus Cloacimonadota bacterium]MCK9332152.1 hypothetical protein [Candidatus Cloacimonadota bacterium]MDD2210375.1 hypothetical protein [Candidatus Cloacimonadota bacterium]MDD4687498.1 hypothetical protein [Candidatus Cloacimonadota bacterium]MDY0298873.1 hypothetical protein [Candidatus Cloacimonadaceae bacterium]
MIIEFKDVCSKEGLQGLSLKLSVNDVSQLYDPSENLSRAILNAIMGLDEVLSGGIYIDGVGLPQFLDAGLQASFFGYVFDEGIMLSNLSLYENLMLPIRWLHPDMDDDEINTKIKALMTLFGLNLDLSFRPVRYRAGDLKLLSFVRCLLIEPKVLLIDDPYYILNKRERSVLYRVLGLLREKYSMLIASIDDDFGRGFANEIIDLSEYQEYFIIS